MAAPVHTAQQLHAVQQRACMAVLIGSAPWLPSVCSAAVHAVVTQATLKTTWNGSPASHLSFVMLCMLCCRRQGERDAADGAAHDAALSLPAGMKGVGGAHG